MPRHHKTLNRLFVEADLFVGSELKLGRMQTGYLMNVVRKKVGDQLVLLNGRDGAFLAEVCDGNRKGVTVRVLSLVARQSRQPDLWYFFAPLKSARQDYMVQKAVEMGVGHLQPVITRHTQNRRTRRDKMHANAVEAAEQCEILSLPDIYDPVSLEQLLETWEERHGDRVLIFADEEAIVGDPLPGLHVVKHRPLGLIVGPEGGFSEQERLALGAAPFCLSISLGPRILRADTAAVAALALIRLIVDDGDK